MSDISRDGAGTVRNIRVALNLVLEQACRSGAIHDTDHVSQRLRQGVAAGMPVDDSSQVSIQLITRPPSESVASVPAGQSSPR